MVFSTSGVIIHSLLLYPTKVLNFMGRDCLNFFIEWDEPFSYSVLIPRIGNVPIRTDQDARTMTG